MSVSNLSQHQQTARSLAVIIFQRNAKGAPGALLSVASVDTWPLDQASQVRSTVGSSPPDPPTGPPWPIELKASIGMWRPAAAGELKMKFIARIAGENVRYWLIFEHVSAFTAHPLLRGKADNICSV